MKEQSHKDEMSAALRGDFRRLRERGVTTTLSPGETGVLKAAAPELEIVEPEPELQPELQPEPEHEVEPERPQGWLGRLLGR